MIGERFTYPLEPLHRVISKTVKKYPDALAYKYQDQLLTYSMLEEQSDYMAAFLMANGLCPGTVVGVLLDRSATLVVTLLAILKAGGVYLPMDIDFPEDRILYMLEDSGATMLLTYSDKRVFSAENLTVINLSLAEIAQLKPELPRVSHEWPAYILYTSGSTGRPKGVKVTHQNLVNLLMSMFSFPGMVHTDKLLAVTTISFDISNLELFLPLTAGATLVMADAATARDGKALFRMMKQEQITFMQATPATWKLLLLSGWDEKLDIKIVSCGEPLPKDLAEKILERCASLWNMYGPTETTIYSTGKQILKTDRVITIGKPIGNTEVYILDDQLNPVPWGEIGEIYISGDGVTQGYFAQPELDAEKFVIDPFKDGSAKMYRTGDLGQLTADDEILYLGRLDKQIKIRGYRIEAGEIEYQLKKCPEVAEAVVTTRTDRSHDLRLVAYVMLKDFALNLNFKSLQHDFKDRLAQELPSYMIPSEFYLLEELPLTLNGKIDYKALPAAVRKTTGKVIASADTELEKNLFAIWAEALDTTDFTIDDDFLDVGGHSLIALYIMNEIEKLLGKTVPISALYEYPTIRKLAAVLDNGISDSLAASLVKLKSGGDKHPLYLIHGNGLNLLNFNALVQYLPDDQPVYGFQAIGLNASDAEIGTMEQVAARYVKELLHQNPDGPYLLAGYSYGGNIGIEMARILKNMGKEIRLLALFDANAQNSEKYNSWTSRIGRKILRQGPKAVWFTRSLVKTPAKAIGYQLFLLRNNANRILQKLRLVKQEKSIGVFEQLERVTQKYNEAYYNYRIKPYDGEIYLFKAAERVYFVDDAEQLGWGKYALKVHVREVPGDHKTMFEEPNVATFAAELTRVIDAINCA
ncbi:non-ribosomal peptide synthetase [Mucilaginibacter straminoryzae]|uniref:non-ribosomal peptide synthetase n=1 Tax=Mucilaginibacter straminoryzae TaxID=2932774 RepID=UPI001FD641F2|nr:non-ribosomal peptide synthetase [Mucilaginibacter straminoryzae]